jgi:hypothetical protein
MNNKHQEKGAPTGALIFTLPASSSVVILRPNWLDGTGQAAVSAKTHGWEAPENDPIRRALPSVFNSNYRLGPKRLTVRSVQTNAMIAAVLLAITVTSRASVDEVTRWNQVATDATAVANTNPLTESRIFAILHVAIHDAVNAVECRYEPYQPRTSPAPGLRLSRGRHRRRRTRHAGHFVPGVESEF